MKANCTTVVEIEVTGGGDDEQCDSEADKEATNKMMIQSARLDTMFDNLENLLWLVFHQRCINIYTRVT